ncbi:MAG TPA: phosphomannose isomerase type II C-terminal cupin domain [Syntrophorhabdales bacterium]|nr:phosphomannose isomerase type II C-terminal cupin domain [Syntrophorhabdales bacterium]
MYEEDHRPWGHFCVLEDAPHHKVKRIVIQPRQRLSLQKHGRRREHWFILEGEAVVTRNDAEIRLSAGEAIDIPEGAWHRVKNPGTVPLIFVEVQTGDYFGEDDITRAEDDYGRA